MKSLKELTAGRLAIAIVAGLGVILSLAQYLCNRSLWLDEAMLALNLMDRGFADLLRPLDYGQAAPPLFLEIEKLFSLIIPNSEYGLRLFPLLSFWASIWLFCRMAAVCIKNRAAIAVAAAIFVFRPHIAYFASEVKPYMADVFSLLTVYWLLLKPDIDDRRRFIALAVAGSVAIFLSNVAPVILASAGMFMIVERWKAIRLSAKQARPLVALFALWMAVFATYYFCFIHNHPLREMMERWWETELPPAFLQFDRPADVLLFLREHVLFPMTMNSVSLMPILFYGTMTVAGIIYLCRHRSRMLILLLAPIAIHVLLSTVKLYPCSIRTMLYCCPCLVLAAGYGVQAILTVLAKIRLPFLNHRRLQTAALLLTLMPLGQALTHFPQLREELKQSADFITKNGIDATCTVFCSDNALPAYEYYRRTGRIGFKNATLRDMKPTGILLWQKDDAAQHEALLNDIVRERGLKYVIFTAMNYDYAQEYVINRLDELGHRRAGEFHCDGSAVYLYEIM
jgi:hypothetical protein